MFEKIKFYFILALAVIMLLLFVPWQTIASYVKFEFIKKNDVVLNFRVINQQIHALAADPSNRLPMEVEVLDSKGAPLSNASIRFTSYNIGSFYPEEKRTDSYGRCIVEYLPPESEKKLFEKGKVPVVLMAEVLGTGVKASFPLELVPVPVVLIHGYQAGDYVFTNFLEYLTTQGYSCRALSYDSEAGIVQGAHSLNLFLQQQKTSYMAQGIQVRKFDLIAHSMGGLVSRYYTCSREYIQNTNVRKIIFISVPQKGSPLAPLGSTYFKDQGIKDLIPDNTILTRTFPEMINQGLNHTIQVGSLLGENDEVVSPESSSLEEWGIKTEIFAVGDSSMTIQSLLKGNFTEATNHMSIISNKLVFEKVKAMLSSKLPFPRAKAP